jgi:hypothetical protein
MKHLLVIVVLIFLRAASYAQTITGKLIDKQTGVPLRYILVACSTGSAFTDDSGNFQLKITNPVDTIRINSMGCKPFELAAHKWGSFSRLIELEIKLTELNEVKITARRNYHKDSVSLRQEYTKQFNFRGPRFNEIVRMPSASMPFAGITIDVGNLYKALTKKHNADYKLQQILLRDERENHVSNRFNKTIVSNLTSLRGDSLENFMSSCRPAATLMDRMSDYDLIQYVKTNLEKFKLNGSKPNLLPTLLKPGQSLAEQ